MIVLLICAGSGFALGLYGSSNRKLFVPAIALVMAALIITAKRWMHHVGIESRIEGETFVEMATNFFAALSPIGQIAVPAFAAAIGVGLYAGTLIKAFKESRGEDPYKKKIRILSEHGMKEFD